MRRLYEKKYNPLKEIDQELFNEFWDIFNQAADQGLTSAPVQIDYVDKDADFYNELQRNNGVFAAFKTHRMQNDMAAMLVGDDGKLKTFREWEQDTASIRKHHVKHWLRTEHTTAVRRARLAAEWRQFEREKDILPNIEWLQTTAVTPGKDHEPFWGVILPIDHPFWSKHRPGDRWGCKCGWRNTDADINPPKNNDWDTPTFAPAKGLENNPGKDAMLFSKAHPYVSNSHKRAKKAVNDLLKKINKFVLYKQYKSGGEVLIHSEVNKKGVDFKPLLTIANQFAIKGQKVKLTPKVHYKSKDYSKIYGALKGTAYYRKCPDLQIGNSFYEFEGYIPPFKKNKTSNMLSKGLKQSDRIIINNTNGATDRFISRLIYNRIRNGVEVKEVWIYEKGKIRLLYKKQ